MGFAHALLFDWILLRCITVDVFLGFSSNFPSRLAF